MKIKRQPLRGLGYLVVLLVLGLTLTPLIWADYPQAKEVHFGSESGPGSAAPRRPLNPKPAPPGTGFIPPEMDLSHLTGQRMPEVSAALPSRFDWRTTGKVTSVKNQGSICGSCYAFAALANFESALLIAAEGSHDYSENNVKECNWYDTSCAGGDYWKVASFLSKNGTVRESCDPYVASDVSCRTTCPYQKTLLDWRIISESSVPSTNVLKTYIQTHGPVYTSIYAGNNDAWETEFQGYNGSYTLHYSGSDNTNHAVLIVGWDDTLSHTGVTGAWIVKNSWGTNWGGTCGHGSERGYFTIAYGSANIGRYSSFIHDWQDYDSSGGLMFYDEGGWTDSRGYSGSTTAWGLCRFIPSENTYLTRVEFWTSDATTDVDVYIYDNFNTSTKTPSNLLHTDLNNSFTEAGYHSVIVDPPLALTTSNDVVAVVKFTNSSYGYPVVVDNQGPSETQRTYLSKLGNDGTWADLGPAVGADVAIRLRTSGSTPAAPTPTATSSPTVTPSSPTPTATGGPTVSPSLTPTRTPRGAGGMVYLPLVIKDWSPGPATAPALYPITDPENDGIFGVGWSSVPGTAYYSLQEASNAGFGSAYEAYSGPATSVTITGKAGGTYYYRVRGCDSLGCGPWSNIQSVTVSPPPAQPGSWSGITVTSGYESKPKTLSFNVTPDGDTVLNAAIVTYYQCRSGGWTYDWIVTWNISTPITIYSDGSFFFDDFFGIGWDYLMWEGQFISPYAAAGTYTFSHWSAECGGDVFKSGTWTASYISPASSEPSDKPTAIHAVVERQE